MLPYFLRLVTLHSFATSFPFSFISIIYFFLPVKKYNNLGIKFFLLHIWWSNTWVIVQFRPWTLPYIHACQIITQHLVILMFLFLSLEEGSRCLACAECNTNDTNKGVSLEPAIFKGKLSHKIMKYNLFIKE